MIKKHAMASQDRDKDLEDDLENYYDQDDDDSDFDEDDDLDLDDDDLVDLDDDDEDTGEEDEDARESDDDTLEDESEEDEALDEEDEDTDEDEEDEDTDEDEELEEETAEEETSGGGPNVLVIVLAVVSVLSLGFAGVLAYFQFVDSEGNFSLALRHPQAATEDTSAGEGEGGGIKGSEIQLPTDGTADMNNDELIATVEKLQSKNERLIARNDSLKQALMNAPAPGEGETSGGGSAASGGGPPAGTVYEIQIGAFKNFDLEDFDNNLMNVQQFQEGGLTKISIGRFRDPDQAERFLRQIQELGFQDAFIIKRVDGKRVEYDHFAQKD